MQRRMCVRDGEEGLMKNDRKRVRICHSFEKAVENFLVVVVAVVPFIRFVHQTGRRKLCPAKSNTTGFGRGRAWQNWFHLFRFARVTLARQLRPLIWLCDERTSKANANLFHPELFQESYLAAQLFRIITGSFCCGRYGNFAPHLSMSHFKNRNL